MAGTQAPKPPRAPRTPQLPHPSEITKNEAEAAAFLATRDKETAEARKLQAEAEWAEIELRSKQRAEDNELAKDVHHHVYVFDKEVTEASVKACITQLAAWSRQDPKCGIEIQVNSPGGSIFDGLALIDFIRGLRTSGHHITMVAIGMAASMAGVILQAADTRAMGANALMLIHEGSLGAIGDFGKVEDRVALMKLMHERILDLFADRAVVSKTYIRNHWKRKDWWLDSAEALKLGFVDEVR